LKFNGYKVIHLGLHWFMPNYNVVNVPDVWQSNLRKYNGIVRAAEIVPGDVFQNPGYGSIWAAFLKTTRAYRTNFAAVFHRANTERKVN